MIRTIRAFGPVKAETLCSPREPTWKRFRHGSAQATLLTLLGLLLAGRIWWTHPNNSPGGRDDIKYLLLAQQISGVATAPLPHRPQYPPGWPALLALNYAGGGTLATAHYLNFASIWVSIGLAVVFARRYVSLTTAVAVGLVFAASRLTVNTGDTLLSEPMFMVLFTLLLILAQRTTSDTLTWKRALVLGILGTGCRAVRTAGISIFGGLVFFILTCPGLTWRKRLAYVALTCLPLALFEPALWTVHDNASVLAGLSGSGYIGQVINSLDEEGQSPAAVSLQIGPLLAHLEAHVRNATSAMIPFDPDWWKPAIAFKAAGAFVLLAGALTILQQLATRQSLPAAILSCYVLLVLCWPSHHLRFFWPLIPFVWTYAACGVGQLGARFRLTDGKRIAVASQGGLVLLAAAAAVCAIWELPIGRDYKLAENDELDAALEWVEAHSEDAGTPRVASVSHFQVQFHRPSWSVVSLPYGDDPDYQSATLSEQNIQWLVEQKTKAKYYQGLEQRGLITIAHSTPKVVVYRVDTTRLQPGI